VARDTPSAAAISLIGRPSPTRCGRCSVAARRSCWRACSCGSSSPSPCALAPARGSGDATGCAGSWPAACAPTGAAISCWCNRRRCSAGCGVVWGGTTLSIWHSRSHRVPGGAAAEVRPHQTTVDHVGTRRRRCGRGHAAGPAAGPGATDGATGGRVKPGFWRLLRLERHPHRGSASVPREGAGGLLSGGARVRVPPEAPSYQIRETIRHRHRADRTGAWANPWANRARGDAQDAPHAGDADASAGSSPPDGPGASRGVRESALSERGRSGVAVGRSALFAVAVDARPHPHGVKGPGVHLFRRTVGWAWDVPQGVGGGLLEGDGRPRGPGGGVPLGGERPACRRQLPVRRRRVGGHGCAPQPARAIWWCRVLPSHRCSGWRTPASG
jgi:hypothetical protein